MSRVAPLVDNTPNPVTAELHRDYPLLWDIAQRYDFAERLGGCTDPLMAEVDAALRELWDARQSLAACPPPEEEK